jgi:lipopolysaccharide/colanic/teichoic acid biosynthesis glycosyltransferase
VYKRVLDIIISALGLIIAIPLGLCVMAFIRFDSPGPLFVRLRRVGRGDSIFTLYKFRSMVMNAHELKESMQNMNERKDGPLFKVKNDPRITRIGRWLRKTSLDELPQLWNVLKGEMSLVGPRPHEPEEVQRYRDEDRGLLAIKPGLTGLAQVSGRSNLLFSEEVALDTYYIEHWSLRMDLQILFKTLIVIFKFRDAA